MPPKRSPSLRERPSEILRTNSTKKPPLQRTGSRSSKYAHIGPKVDNKLAPEFIPAESQFQRPKHKRSSLYIRSDEQAQDSESENEDTGLHSDSSGDATLYEYPSDHGSPTPSSYSADYEEDILAHLGGGQSTSAAASPSHHSDNASPSFQSGHSSRTSSRKGTLEHPTSNPAAYARNTDSYKNKMNGPLEYNGSAPSTPGSGHQVSPRPTLLRGQSVKFKDPPEIESRSSLHDRRRGQSLHAKPLLETTFLKSLRDALNITCDDLLDVRDALISGNRMLDFREVLQKQEGFPPDVNGVRHKIVEVIEGMERQYAEDLRHLDGIVEKESGEEVGRYKVRIEEVEEELRIGGEEWRRKERENDSWRAEREGRINELEGRLQESNEERERAKEKLEETSHALSSQAQQLEDVSLTIETQASQIRQLEASLEERPAISVSQDQLQAAFHLHEQDVQKIQHLEEALQVKRVNNALATGTDTPEWHDVFKRERKIRAAQEHEITHLKTSIKKLDTYHVDLEREVRALREYVTLHRDTTQLLQDKLSASKSHAQQWKFEYEQQKEMLDQRDNIEETTLAALREEMHHTISSYQALLPTPDNPDALEVTGLLRKLEAQDHVLKDVTQHLETLKQEKASLETSISQVLKENSDLRHGPPLSPHHHPP
ncbi:uncharacterized protein N0V89_004948 [Didymosphaeria variabile]|uniref:Uncharacterized protein n=1 Tax=Didymosphaeria variabile TaxID=1932322 RepID=A0A9W8XK54_9PLEO|nr:uncharacterized protein N0V89_004948 [Didymosphaeria variabile]KAJ4353221.1 hypothetical protein N0V89_004948 [Didymosphaeria variabile]